MTQEQFNTIVKVISNGAPALASELVPALQQLVAGYQKQAEELEQLKQSKSQEVPLAELKPNPTQEGGK